MKPFKMVVKPWFWKSHEGYRHPVFCKIEYEERNGGMELSISGVVGPTPGGNCAGDCGQIDTSIRKYPKEYTAARPDWTPEMCAKFLDIWDEWHLNRMHAYDAEMKAAGWREKARTPMKGYEFRLRPDIAQVRRKAEQEAVEALRKGESVVYPPDIQKLANLPYNLTLWVYAREPEPAPPEHYERDKYTYGHSSGALKHPESKTLGWLYPKDHPDGLLTRKLRPDGPGYGSNWYAEEVPEEVLGWLQALPASDVKPAWV